MYGREVDAVANRVAADLRAELDYLTAELVPHHGVGRHPETVLHGVQVGAADSAGVDLEHHLATPGDGPRHVDHGHLIGLLIDRGFHRNASRKTSRRNCLAATAPGRNRRAG